MATDPNKFWQRDKAPHEDFKNIGRHLRSSSSMLTQHSATTDPSTDLRELIQQLQNSVNELTAKVQALSKPIEEQAKESHVPALSNEEVDDIVTARLFNYAPQELHSAIKQILDSGRATVHDFVDRDLESKTFGRFLSKDVLSKKVEELTRTN